MLDAQSAETLLPLVYDELRRLAASYLRREGGYHTLQPTALVHEAYVRLAAMNQTAWQGKAHFLAMAATQMRRILVEHARAASARKRGSRPTRVTFEEGMGAVTDRTVEVLALDEALQQLAARKDRQARVAEMRLFAGMQFGEIATALGVSERTTRGDWRLARARLARMLGGPPG